MPPTKLMDRPFLTARWEHLLLLNYECPRDLLEPLVPAGTRLDPWDGVPLVSLVGFLFRDTRLKGIAIPFHRDFEEVNLRFYVRRETRDEVRRAVVFIRELVPRRAIAGVARWLYNEPYRAVPMSHRVSVDPGRGGSVEYGWRYRGHRLVLRGHASGPVAQSPPGSEAEFVAEHYWGYTRQRNGDTLEYRVEHPRWEVWVAETAGFEVRPAAGERSGARTSATAALYGQGFAEVLASEPRSAFLALGSRVAVFPGRRLERSRPVG